MAFTIVQAAVSGLLMFVFGGAMDSQCAVAESDGEGLGAPMLVPQLADGMMWALELSSFRWWKVRVT